MCGKRQSSCWWQQEWTRGAVASHKYYEAKWCWPWKHTDKENPFDSCHNRNGNILGLTVQNTPNNPSPLIRSSGDGDLSGLCVVVALWGNVLILSRVLVQLSLSHPYCVIFPANILTEMSLKCNIFSSPSRQSLILETPPARKNRWERIYAISVFMTCGHGWLQRNLNDTVFHPRCCHGNEPELNK